MLLEIMETLVILLIAVPFMYIVLDVIVDIVKRTYGFYKREAKPILVKVKNPLHKY